MWPLKAIELVASGRVAQLFFSYFSLLRNLFSLQAFTFRSSMVGLLSGLARSLSPSATCSTGGLEGIMCLAAGRLQKPPSFMRFLFGHRGLRPIVLLKEAREVNGEGQGESYVEFSSGERPAAG